MWPGGRDSLIGALGMMLVPGLNPVAWGLRFVMCAVG